MQFFELNIDGLVGQTHNYAGLAAGNLASILNALRLSDPKAAALQGIAKMQLLHRLGLKQALMPPHQRPNLHLLHELGFRGTPEQQIKKALKNAPELLSACYSASSMWTANAATVSASPDSEDHRVHFTAANLISNLHRHQEADFSSQLLKRLFSEPRFFQHHPVLPRTFATSDEGAANHNRLCRSHGESGINIFVYGKRAFQNASGLPGKHPARQTIEASQAIARAHLLNPNKVIFAHQNPQAIDEGVFHNDVIGLTNENVLLLHQDAWLEQNSILQEIQMKANFPLQIIEVKRDQLPLAEAVSSYLFNSQLITLPDCKEQRMALLAPSECEENPRTKALIDSFINDKANPITTVYYLDLRQSMRNGGGPACLRLRVPLNEIELNAMHQGVLITDTLLSELENWVERHYRSQLHAQDLSDPLFIDECLTALDDLTDLLQLGSIYPFQLETTSH
jgi:succinylarginine dihydrolase